MSATIRLSAPASDTPGDLTRISTTEPIWEIVRYDDQAQAWIVVDSGPLIVEARGEVQNTPCAYLPQMSRCMVINH